MNICLFSHWQAQWALCKGWYCRKVYPLPDKSEVISALNRDWRRYHHRRDGGVVWKAMLIGNSAGNCGNMNKHGHRPADTGFVRRWRNSTDAFWWFTLQRHWLTGVIPTTYSIQSRKYERHLELNLLQITTIVLVCVTEWVLLFTPCNLKAVL